MSQLGNYDITLRMRRAFGWLPRAVDTFGEQALFYAESIRYMPNAVRRYRKETIRLIAEMTMGTGALVIIGGTVGVAAFLTLASGGVIAVQGYESLGNIGIEALTGFLSAYLNVRIVAPIIAGIALAATIGAGTTAQLGAMRIAEEIDAVEAMAVHSVSYLVSTRHRRRAGRDHSAVLVGHVGRVLLGPHHHRLRQRTIRRSLRPLLQHVPDTDRSVVVFRSGHRDGDRGDAGAYLLRLQRIRRTRRRGHRCG